MNYQVTNYNAQTQIFERRVKLLTEKKSVLQRELQTIAQTQDKELKRLNTDLQTVNGSLQAAKRDFELKANQYKELKVHNDEQKTQNWE